MTKAKPVGAKRLRPTRGRICKNMDVETAKQVMSMAQDRIKPCPACGADAWVGGNQNKMHAAGVEINFIRHPVRKAVYILGGGRPLNKNEVLSNTCEHTQCLGNLKPIKKAAIPIMLAKQGKIHNAIHNASKAKERTTRPGNKLNMERAREMRASTDDLKDIAEKNGISRTMASRIMRNLSYREVNPFSGLFRSAA